MTRWARGGSANRKKPLDATEWTEMTSDVSCLNTNATAEKRTTNQSVPHKSKDKLKSKQKVQSNGQQKNVANELEMLAKESVVTGSLSNSVVLEEFVRKDARREARRLKRQEQRRQARVCAGCSTVCTVCLYCTYSNRVTNSLSHSNSCSRYSLEYVILPSFYSLLNSVDLAVFD